MLRDGAKYYGPYPDAGALHANIKLIRQLFPLRHCRNMNVKRPCLQYHLKRCLAPCTGKVKQSEYMAMINSVLLLMDGKITDLKKELKAKMAAASELLEFEAAGRYRDAINSLAYLGKNKRPPQTVMTGMLLP